jgi:O-antigen/teichoic acid export membrane protein
VRSPATPAVGLAASIGTLLAGTGVAQGLSAAALPVLTRLYVPEDFGVLAFFGAAAMLTGLVVTGRYELAIPIVEMDDEARDLLRLATTLGLAASALLLLVGFWSFSRMQIPAWSALAWLAPSLALTSLYQPLSYWFTRRFRFRAVAITRVLQSAATLLVQLALGVAGRANAPALIAGVVAGQAAATVGLEVTVRREVPVRGRLGPGLARARDLAHRHRRFPQFTMLAGLLQVGADQAPLMVTPFFLGPSVAGTYALPARLLSAASSLLSGSTAQAFYPTAARQLDAGRLGSACLELHRSLLRIATTPILLIAIVAPQVAGLAFGTQWTDSGEWFRLLVPWSLTALSFGPITQVLLVLERQRDSLVLQAVLVAGTLTALVVGASVLPARGAILLFSATGAAIRIVGIELAARAAGAPRWQSIRIFATELGRALPFVMLAAAVKVSIPGSTVALVAVAALTAIHAGLQLREHRRATDR